MVYACTIRSGRMRFGIVLCMCGVSSKINEDEEEVEEEEKEVS